MIFIGTTNLTRTRQQGQFYCPHCQSEQPFRLRSRRPFLTVYFIPTVPIGDAQRFVQCGQCEQRWDETVLQYRSSRPQPVERAKFESEAFQAAILIVLVDGNIDETEIMALHDVAIRLSGSEIDRESLGRLCSVAQENRITAANYLCSISRRWTVEQREEALAAMFVAATAHGAMKEKQADTLAKLRDILDLSDDQYETAIESTLQ